MSECICEGNWRKIIEDYEPLFGNLYYNKHKKEIYIFIGIMHSRDDYYYCMENIDTHQLKRLSCVGRIKDFGYDEVNE